MQGKVCVVTGATNGIGKATAQGLARLGATVVLVARNESLGRAVVSELVAAGNPNIHLKVADLSSMASVRKLAADLGKDFPRIDVLVNNAGGEFGKKQLTADGYELTFALDHLSPFLLTNLLLENLKAAPAARVVTVSSSIQSSGNLDFDDLMYEKRKYSGWQAYCDAKRANVLFTTELATRLAGTKVTANSLHPGVVRTNFISNSSPGLKFVLGLLQPLFLTPEKGAATSIFLASSAEVEGVTGNYFDKCVAVPSSKGPDDPEVASRLWEVSARLVGL